MRTENQNKALLNFIYTAIISNSNNTDKIENIKSFPYYDELVKYGFDANIYIKLESEFDSGNKIHKCYYKYLVTDIIKNNLQQFYLYTFCLSIIKEYPDKRLFVPEFIKKIDNENDLKTNMTDSACERVNDILNICNEKMDIDNLTKILGTYRYRIEKSLSVTRIEKHDLFKITELACDIPISVNNTTIEVFLGMPIYTIPN